MLFSLPSDDVLYQALVDSDPSYEGRALVGVTSTGIFCRLVCPARNPLQKNCSFFETAADCLEAGFRPCKRCHPLGQSKDPVIATPLAALESDPLRRWSETDVENMGLDPSTVRRTFKRQFGLTFLEMARLRRLKHGFRDLAEGKKVIDAQLTAGFDSPASFRKAFAKLLGVAPGTLTPEAMLKADWIETPIGPMIIVADKQALHLLEFADRKALPTELQKILRNTKGQLGIGRTKITDQTELELKQFFAGNRADFSVPLAYHGTDFTNTVWRALQNIPAGETRSYLDLAKSIDRPTATRAVARANGANQIALIIPCHRVIGADGSLTGYGGGLWRKQKLIELEKQYA
jgi:AraC family transcriptional regulator, regulatory protein of adaptative response / methylated-DNA-[protein]-cysteine methyltransferase